MCRSLDCYVCSRSVRSTSSVRWSDAHRSTSRRAQRLASSAQSPAGMPSRACRSLLPPKARIGTTVSRLALSARYRGPPTGQEGSQHPLPDPNDRGGDRHNRESVRRCASLIARQRVSSTAAEAVTMALTREARTTTTWCVSKSNSCIDTRRFRRQAERLRWPKVRRAVRGRELERSSSVGRPLVLVGTRCEAEV
jgi:hypothetical protein